MASLNYSLLADVKYKIYFRRENFPFGTRIENKNWTTIQLRISSFVRGYSF